MRKVLVVGGAGYVGGIFVDLLQKEGFDVGVYDNLTYELRYLKDCKFFFGDVRDTKKLLKIQKDFDEVMWLAALVGDGACVYDPDLTMDVNVHSLRRFVDKAGRRVVFTSTCSVYGVSDELLTEESLTNPQSVYAVSKLEAEKCVLDNGGLVLRLGTLYGLGDSYSRLRLDLVVNMMILKALKEGKLTVFGGEQWRPIIAVSDVGGYLVEAVSNGIDGLFNVLHRNIKIVDLAREIARLFPGVEVEFEKRRYENVRNYRVDSRKLDRHFKFRPKASVKSEARRMKKIFEERRIKDWDNRVYRNAEYIEYLLKVRGDECNK